ncbi:peptide chain release factor N(5)-glutamine methyltransferase [Desulfovibrio sp. OttesenSCG-928-C06]|nr:peptide chain release factor N(5)-glutamine methyltransferase [Desulfovibrio sp. OttesenSCG-928-C06]
MPQPQELAATLRERKRAFEEAGTESPALSAELLLAHALGLDRQELLRLMLMEPKRALSAEEAGRFSAYAARRLQGEPVAYITGSKEFYGRDFTVTPATLIPRPETELIVDKALELFGSAAESSNNTHKTSQPRFFADFGTGSGCLAVTLALELNQAAASGAQSDAATAQEAAWRGLALDISHDALQAAAANAARLGAAQRLEFRQADFSVPLPQLLEAVNSPLIGAGTLDLLVSNPPYVSETEYRTIAVEVRKYEPRSALVPAVDKPMPDGSELLPLLSSTALRLLKSGGVFLMEIGHDQGDFMRALLQSQSCVARQIGPESGSQNAALPSELSGTANASGQPEAPGPCWLEWEVMQDLAGLDRTVFARKK